MTFTLGQLFVTLCIVLWPFARWYNTYKDKKEKEKETHQ